MRITITSTELSDQKELIKLMGSLSRDIMGDYGVGAIMMTFTLSKMGKENLMPPLSASFTSAVIDLMGASAMARDGKVFTMDIEYAKDLYSSSFNYD